MAMKAMTLVGLDVHARQTHAAVLVPDTGELRVSRLQVAPGEVVRFLEGLGPRVLAVYGAGPTGFSLARAACERAIDVRVACAARRFPRPNRLAGFLGIVPSERTSDLKRRQRSITKAGPATRGGCSSRPRATTAMSRASARRSPAASLARTRASSNP
jgi:Transposase IS116/IS110/IS902 family